ncbi:response regulator transcription factor [Paenibacillus rigui]|uniref:DNA-binding response regulator n=1 Tax=Paenibacillus rigui TaxID=554312 RepID=A0A229UK43_9BACL|nr:response regulator [Paenibacillus rigui]OXM83818.1 hypothetical protein CF651_23175 [Paenibacillus rigui]
MLRVLLVDDEPGQIIGFRKLLQRVRPDYDIASARNGYDAISLCEKQTFDLIFTDIQMQVMNGLELMERLDSGLRTRAKVIVLSGYDYFDYAQRALAHGAFAYLLKPLDLNTLQDVLRRAEHALDQEEAKFKVYRERLQMAWMKGTVFPEEDMETKQLLPWHESGHVCLVRLRFGSITEVLMLQKQLEVSWKESGLLFSVVIHDKLPVLAAVVNGNRSRSDFVEMREKLAREGTALRDACLAVSSWGTFTEGIHDKYKEAEAAAAQQFYEPDGHVFIISESRIADDYKPVIQAKEETAVLEALRQNDTQGLKSLLQSIINGMLTGKYPLPDYMKLRCKVMVTKWLDEVELLRQNHDTYKELMQGVETAIEQAGTMAELIGSIEELLLAMMQMAETIKLHRKDEMIYQYLAYIDDHYMEDLSLEKIAGHFELSPNYFSQYFRSRLDINFTKYVTQVKLNKAKQLLENQSDKIYAIAAQIGYQEVKYFNRVFKKEFGMTPEEYRRSIRMLRKK